MLAPNANLQRDATNLFQNIPSSAADPDTETVDEHIVEDIGEPKDQAGENDEGMVMEPTFRELEEENKVDEAKKALTDTDETKNVIDDPVDSMSKTSYDNYWEYLKANYGNNCRKNPS